MGDNDTGFWQALFVEVTDKVTCVRLGDIPVFQGKVKYVMLRNEVIFSLGFTFGKYRSRRRQRGRRSISLAKCEADQIYSRCRKVLYAILSVAEGERLAKRSTKNSKLSSQFLAGYRLRLDAIGSWSVLAGPDNHDLIWPSPAGLELPWPGCSLSFHTDSDWPTFDPDDRMFGLWELFLARQSVFAPQLGEVVAAARLGAVRESTLVVAREGKSRRPNYSLTLEIQFERDREHLYQSFFDEDAQLFGAMYA